jgi:hypothetical protein
MYNSAPLDLSILPVARRDCTKKRALRSLVRFKRDEPDTFCGGAVHPLMRYHAAAPKGCHGSGFNAENTLDYRLPTQNSDEAEKDRGQTLPVKRVFLLFFALYT